MSKTPNFSQLAETEWSTESDWFGEDFDNKPSIQSSNTNSNSAPDLMNVVETQPAKSPAVLSGFDDVLDDLETNEIKDSLSIKPPVSTDATYENYDNTSSTNNAQDIFELANSLGLIYIPEGFDTTNLDEDKLVKLAEETNKFRLESIHEAYKQQIAHDPYMLEMLEYSRQGGKFADLPRMKEVLESEIDYTSLNLDDVTTQKNLVYQFLSDGLDPNNPKDARILNMIPGQIEELSKELKLKNEALNAQRYFLNIIEEERQLEYQRIEQAKQQDYIRQQQEQAEIDKWDREFRQALESSKWTNEKKQAVINESGYIALNDGRRMPLWQYKQEIIFNNPALFQQFLDFTSKFDVKTGQFSDVVKQSSEQSAVKTILDRINKKGQNFNKTQEVNFNNNNTKPRMVVDNTKDDWGTTF